VSVSRSCDSDDALVLVSSAFSVSLLQSLLQLRRKLVKASLATGLQIDVIEFGFLM